MNLKRIFKPEAVRREVLAAKYIVPLPGVCIQCGICSYNCPINIDIRWHVWMGQPIKDSHCLTCGECIARCPRGGLRFADTNIFADRRQKERA